MADVLTFPRWVHQRGGAVRLTEDAADHAAALADGWAAEPVPMRIAKGEETTAVYTAAALSVALAQGWTLVVASPAKKGAK